MMSTNPRLILLTCCIDPGGARKSQYIIVSDPHTALNKLRDQTEDLFCLFDGQRIKMHILYEEMGYWHVETSYDLEQYFQATYKRKKYYFNEDGPIDDHTKEFQSFMKKLEYHDPEDLGIRVQLINEQGLIQILSQYTDYKCLDRGTSIKIKVDPKVNVTDIDDDIYVIQDDWYEME